MKVREICSSYVFAAEPDTDLRTAARLMRTNHVGALVVIDHKEGVSRPAGIVTDRDILVSVVAAPGVRPESLTVRDVMTASLTVAKENDGVFEAAAAMKQCGARRLPVVAADGRLVGMLTLDDLLRVLATEIMTLAEAIEHANARERKERRTLENVERVA